jgi:hypothetical protein
LWLDDGALAPSGLLSTGAAGPVFTENGGDYGAGKACSSSQDVATGRAQASIGREQYGLVPDDVAQVILGTATGEVPAIVHDNFYDVVVTAEPGESHAATKVLSVTWQNSHGDTIGPPLGQQSR